MYKSFIFIQLFNSRSKMNASFGVFFLLFSCCLFNVIQSQRDEFWNRDRRHCYWSGRNSWPICNGFCRPGEFVLTTSDIAPGGNKCLAGQLSYCCRRRNGNNDDFRPNPPQTNFNSVSPPNWDFPGLRAVSAALNAVASEIAPNTQPPPWMRPSASRP